MTEKTTLDEARSALDDVANRLKDMADLLDAGHELDVPGWLRITERRVRRLLAGGSYHDLS